MQKQKCALDLYVNFLTASQKQFSGVELSKAAPEPMAHDSVSRWLSTAKLTPKLLWQQSQSLVNKQTGYLIIDDSVLDKPLLSENGTGQKTVPGKHRGIVSGIGLVSLLWTDGQRLIPIDYRSMTLAEMGKVK
jgi:hypothetical protein